ncbi:MAG: YlbL family protein [Actinomycetota bacterium]
MQRDFPDHSKKDVTVRPPSLRPWLIVLIILALLGASLVIPVPSILRFVPGPVRDVEGLIEVSGRETFSSEGSFYLTTVRVDDSVTVAEWVWSYFDSETMVVDEEGFTQGLSLKELNRIQRQQMTASKRAAASVALTAIGADELAGVEIASVVSEPAEGRLDSGDVITTIDGESVGTACDLLVTLAGHSPGEMVEFEVADGSKTRAVDIRLGAAPDDDARPFIGIEMAPDDFGPIDYRFKTGEIAGPSAGLMFSLALYDRLTPDDLTAGRRVAGTGTIACNGSVGEIGGIEQKVAGAEAEGAKLFLAPAGNAAAAREAADDIEIVAVGSFEDAVDHLESLD